MAVGVRFGFGPLVAYIPLTGQRRGRRAAAATGRAVASGTKGFARVYWWALVVAFFVVAWPYPLVRWVGDRNGWDKSAAVMLGVGAVAVWILLAVAFSALTGGSTSV